MQLLCPKCQNKVNIEDQSRYLTYTCKGCGERFCGMNANGVGEGVVSSFLSRFNPFAEIRFVTSCPSCGVRINLAKDDDYIGVLGPECCWSCRNHLPG